MATEGGLKPIEQVQAGEKVWAYDTTSGSWHLQTVEAALGRQYQGDLVHLEFSGYTLEVTGDHPLWVVMGHDLLARPPPHDTELYEMLTVPSLQGKCVGAQTTTSTESGVSSFGSGRLHHGQNARSYDGRENSPSTHHRRQFRVRWRFMDRIVADCAGFCAALGRNTLVFRGIRYAVRFLSRVFSAVCRPRSKF